MILDFKVNAPIMVTHSERFIDAADLANIPKPQFTVVCPLTIPYWGSIDKEAQELTGILGMDNLVNLVSAYMIADQQVYLTLGNLLISLVKINDQVQEKLAQFIQRLSPSEQADYTLMLDLTGQRLVLINEHLAMQQGYPMRRLLAIRDQLGGPAENYAYQLQHVNLLQAKATEIKLKVDYEMQRFMAQGEMEQVNQLGRWAPIKLVNEGQAADYSHDPLPAIANLKALILLTGPRLEDPNFQIAISYPSECLLAEINSSWRFQLQGLRVIPGAGKDLLTFLLAPTSPWDQPLELPLGEVQESGVTLSNYLSQGQWTFAFLLTDKVGFKPNQRLIETRFNHQIYLFKS